MPEERPVARRDLMRHGIMSASALVAAPAVLTGLAPRSATASIETPDLGQPPWYRFAIGDIEATVVSDGLMNIGSAADHFPQADPDALQSVLGDAFLPLEPTLLEQNVLVLNTGDRLVLIDTGTGWAPPGPGDAPDAWTALGFDPGDTHGRLMGNLRAAGFDPAAFTDILITHPHPDHCFGLTDADGAPNFPNAAVHLSQADFGFWTSEEVVAIGGFVGVIAQGAQRNLLPLRDRIAFVEDGQEVLPGITAMATPGHTVGHTSFIIASGDATCFVIGDAAHHAAVSFRHPDWEFSFDTDPEAGAQTRRRVLDMLATDRMRVAGYHFPFPGIGHVSRKGEAFRYVPEPMRHG